MQQTLELATRFGWLRVPEPWILGGGWVTLFQPVWATAESADFSPPPPGHGVVSRTVCLTGHRLTHGSAAGAHDSEHVEGTWISGQVEPPRSGPVVSSS